MQGGGDTTWIQKYFESVPIEYFCATLELYPNKYPASFQNLLETEFRNYYHLLNLV